MIAMLLAAQLSAEIVRGIPGDVALPAKPAMQESSELFQNRRFVNAKACSAASRLQTSDATPALLYRPQDRARTKVSKLKDLPPAEPCLVGSQTVEIAK
jgi:hypothetical protein